MWFVGWLVELVGWFCGVFWGWFEGTWRRKEKRREKAPYRSNDNDKNLSPTSIVHQEDGEDSPELIINPLKMATIFNKFGRQKITKTATEAINASKTRLRNRLNKRSDPPPQFKMKKRGLVTLKKAVKKMKGKRVHSRDEIDS